ncbi:small membrane protein YldA [Escherichia coli]
MAEAFYILIGFLIMAAIIVMAVLYLESKRQRSTVLTLIYW